VRSKMILPINCLSVLARLPSDKGWMWRDTFLLNQALSTAAWSSSVRDSPTSIAYLSEWNGVRHYLRGQIGRQSGKDGVDVGGVSHGAGGIGALPAASRHSEPVSLGTVCGNLVAE
jgi:hypothetical protein